MTLLACREGNSNHFKRAVGRGAKMGEFRTEKKPEVVFAREECGQE